jgi:hypothetical protein
LLNFALAQVRIGQNHGDEEIAPHVLTVRANRLGRVDAGVDGPAEVAVAVA